MHTECETNAAKAAYIKHLTPSLRQTDGCLHGIGPAREKKMTYYAAMVFGLRTTAMCIVDDDGEMRLIKVTRATRDGNFSTNKL